MRTGDIWKRIRWSESLFHLDHFVGGIINNSFYTNIIFSLPSLSFLTIKDVFEMQKGSIQPGQTVLVIDDLIATGE